LHTYRKARNFKGLFIEMKDKLPISVVICALNEESRIKDAILSAKKNEPAEIIVVEGGSTDNPMCQGSCRLN
jgi:hypothetical protein